MTSTVKTVSVVRQTLGYVRTLDHLRAWPLRLPHGVKEVVLAVGSGDERTRRDQVCPDFPPKLEALV